MRCSRVGEWGTEQGDKKRRGMVLGARGRKVMAWLETAAHLCTHMHTRFSYDRDLDILNEKQMLELRKLWPKIIWYISETHLSSASSVSHGLFARACDGASEWACGGLSRAVSAQKWRHRSSLERFTSHSGTPAEWEESVTVPRTTSQSDTSHVSRCVAVVWKWKKNKLEEKIYSKNTFVYVGY